MGMVDVVAALNSELQDIDKGEVFGMLTILFSLTVKLVHKIMRLVLTCALRQNMTHMYLSNVVANVLCRRSHKVCSGNLPT